MSKEKVEKRKRKQNQQKRKSQMQKRKIQKQDERKIKKKIEEKLLLTALHSFAGHHCSSQYHPEHEIHSATEMQNFNEFFSRTEAKGFHYNYSLQNFILSSLRINLSLAAIQSSEVSVSSLRKLYLNYFYKGSTKAFGYGTLHYLVILHTSSTYIYCIALPCMVWRVTPPSFSITGYTLLLTQTSTTWEVYTALLSTFLCICDWGLTNYGESGNYIALKRVIILQVARLTWLRSIPATTKCITKEKKENKEGKIQKEQEIYNICKIMTGKNKKEKEKQHRKRRKEKNVRGILLLASLLQVTTLCAIGIALQGIGSHLCFNLYLVDDSDAQCYYGSVFM